MYPPTPTIKCPGENQNLYCPNLCGQHKLGQFISFYQESQGVIGFGQYALTKTRQSFDCLVGT